MTSAGYPSHQESGQQGATLPDVLDRILDKGLVIAGDVTIQLLDIEILTVKVRLLLASAERAEEMGIDWWKHDSFLSSQARQDEQHRRLQERIDKLEDLLAPGSSGSGASDDGDAAEVTPQSQTSRNDSERDSNDT